MNKKGFGIKQPTKFDMPLNQITKLKCQYSFLYTLYSEMLTGLQNESRNCKVILAKKLYQLKRKHTSFVDRK